MNNDLKCKFCKKDMPKDEYDGKTQSATWFGFYKNNILTEFVCRGCFDDGKRLETQIKLQC